jgi:hypothetical protein
VQRRRGKPAKEEEARSRAFTTTTEPASDGALTPVGSPSADLASKKTLKVEFQEAS